MVSRLTFSYVCKLTLLDIPNSLSIRANAAARFAPKCDMATSTTSSSRHIDTPSCSKCTVTATNALWFGEVHTSVAKLSAPSCSWSILAMCLRVLANTFFTSRETVAGYGMWYSGLPVFIRLWKPRSLTMLKGLLLSATHQTISTSASLLVCCRWENVTFPFPFLSNAAVISPRSTVPLSMALRTSFTFPALSADATTSLLQHFFACFCMLLVDLASPVSRNLLTPLDLTLQ